MDKREAAIALAEKGFRVFPIPQGSKQAVLKDFPNRASSDTQIARDRWSAAVTGDPEHHNIAIATGHEVFVLDFDGDKGRQDLEHYEAIGLDTSAMARTPSGGIHVYLRLPAGSTVRNSVKKIRPGTDVRGHHGYVLAPGSETEQGAYKWLLEPTGVDAIPLAPHWLIKACGQPTEKSNPTESVEIECDTPPAIARGVAYLKDVAPESIQGSGGNDAAYKVAARLRDFAISEGTALDLMLEHWNEQKTSPPWSVDELAHVVGNAYRYAANAPGVSAGNEFDAYVAEPSDPFAPRKRRRLKAADLPKREWIVEGIAARGYLTGLVAPSGAGKTQLLAQIALAVSGVQPMQGFHCNPGRVWMWNQEDDLDELERRMLAAEKRFGVNADERDMHVNSGASKPLVLVKRDPESGFLRTTLAVRNIIASIRELGIDLLIIDPLAEFHEANENDNVEMRYVAAVLRRIAVEGNCAVIVGHHTRKPDSASSDGFAGNADSARGASALQGVTRVMLTLYSMSSKDAKSYGVSEDDRSPYVRLDGAKSNISAAGRGLKPIWYRWQGEALENGDVIGVLEHTPLVRSRSRVEMAAEEASVIVDILAERGEGWHKWGDIAEQVTALTGWSERTAKRYCQTLTGVEMKTSEGRYGGTELRLTNLTGQLDKLDKTSLSSSNTHENQ